MKTIAHGATKSALVAAGREIMGDSSFGTNTTTTAELEASFRLILRAANDCHLTRYVGSPTPIFDYLGPSSLGGRLMGWSARPSLQMEDSRLCGEWARGRWSR
jgi:hypothetical protein